MARSGVIPDGDTARIGYAVRRACEKSLALRAESERLRASSRHLTTEARRLRRREPRPEAVGFRLEGRIDGHRVQGSWTPRGVAASDDLLRRAQVVVALGDTFGGFDGGTLQAALDRGPTQALLTLMRACDRVESVSVTVGRPAASAVRTRSGGGFPRRVQNVVDRVGQNLAAEAAQRHA